MASIISGIGGFIGSNLAERLLRQGNTVIGLDNLGRKGAEENIERIRSAGCPAPVLSRESKNFIKGHP
jgi:CDP-paratose 2-epimerase